jgi:sugar-specific transcriptional regulator TrmB
MRKILEYIGLTKNEAEIYLSLLNLGPSVVGEIVKTTGMHRTSVYGALSRLKEKGLVSSIISANKTCFEATDPNRLMTIVDEKKKALSSIIPKLKSIKKTAMKTEQEVQYFKGKEGLITIFEDIFKTGLDYVGYGPGEQLEKILKYYFPHFIAKRKKAKIHLKLIYWEESRNKGYTNNPMTKVKFLPNEYSSKAAMRIYDNKVAILLLSEDQPLAILIKNKAIADGYKKHFEMLWKMAKD